MSWLGRLLRWLGLDAPAPVPVPPPPPVPAEGTAATMLILHNQERARAGLIPLSIHPTLAGAAASHVAWMARARVLSHQDGANRWPQGRLRAIGWNSPAGENIAEGTATPADTVAAWMASPGHRDNILGAGWRFLGTARAVSPEGRVYWCAVYS